MSLERWRCYCTCCAKLVPDALLLFTMLLFLKIKDPWFLYYCAVCAASQTKKVPQTNCQKLRNGNGVFAATPWPSYSLWRNLSAASCSPNGRSFKLQTKSFRRDARCHNGGGWTMSPDLMGILNLFCRKFFCNKVHYSYYNRDWSQAIGTHGNINLVICVICCPVGRSLGCDLGPSLHRTTDHSGVVAVTLSRPWSIP